MKNRLHIIRLLRTVVFLLLLSPMLMACVEDSRIPNEPRPEGSTKVTFNLTLSGEDESTDAATRGGGVNGAESVDIKNATVLCFKNNRYHYRATHNGPITGDSFSLNMLVDDYEAVLVVNMNDEMPSFSDSDDKLSVLKKIDYQITNSSNKFVVEDSDPNYKGVPMASSPVDVKLGSNPQTGKNITVELRRMFARIDVISSAENFKLNSVSLYNTNSKGFLYGKLDAQGGEEPLNIPSQTKVRGPIKYDELSKVDEMVNKIYLLEARNKSDNNVPVKNEEQTCLVVGGFYKDHPDEYFYRVDLNSGAEESLRYYNVERNNVYQITVTKVDGVGFPSEEDAFNAGPISMEIKVKNWVQGEEFGIEVETDGVYILGIREKRYNVVADAKQGHEITFMSDYPGEITAVASASDSDATVQEGAEWISVDKTLDKETVSGQEEPNYTLKYNVSENTGKANRTAYIHITAGVIDMVVKVVQEGTGIGIKFLQQNEKKEWVEVNSLTFVQGDKSSLPEAQMFRVEHPITATNIDKIIGQVIGASNQIVWKISPLNEVAKGDGYMDFRAQPAIIPDYQDGSFDEAEATFRFEATHNTKNIYGELPIKQLVREIYIVPQKVVMDGEEHKIVVKSNVPWELYANRNISDGLSGHGASNVKVVQEVEGASLNIMDNAPNAKTILVYSNGTSNLPDGEEVVLRTVDDIYVKNEIFKGYLGLYAVSTEEGHDLGDSRDIVCLSGVKQDGREANCYVLTPGSDVGLLVPVRGANGVFVQSGVKGGKPNLFSATKDAPNLSNRIKQGTKFGARLVWADLPTTRTTNKSGKPIGLGEDGLISDVIPVLGNSKFNHLGYVLVLPGERAIEGGNASVAVTNPANLIDGKPEILWSWHIWVTAGMEYDDILMGGVIKGGHFGAQNGGWLDRNLGALSNGYISGDNPETDKAILVSARGYHYQWGRKDPFPTGIDYNVDVGKERYLYNEEGIIEGVNQTKGEGSISFNKEANKDKFPTFFKEAIKRPLTFYTNWDQATGITGKDASTWGNNSVGKTIFDPCPAGWRVPESSDWDNEFDKFINEGRIYVGVGYRGGYYPAAGIRSWAPVIDSGETGYFWSRSVSDELGTNSNILHISKSGIIDIKSSVQMRRYLSSVRCIADE